MLGKQWQAEDEKKESTIVELTSWILEYVEQNTAGSPTDETIKWTHIRHCDIALHLQKTYQEEVGTECIKRILYGNGYRKRKPAKTIATGESPHRNEQCADNFIFVSSIQVDGRESDYQH